MEILFLVPPTELNFKKLSVDRVYGCNYGFDYKPPIHLLLLATLAKQLGHNVRLLDCPAEGYNFKKFLDYLKENISFDMVVFFTVWLSKEEDLLAAEVFHNMIKNVKIIFIGPYPTWQPGLFLKKSNYFVIRGEPEEAFKEIIENMEKGGNIKYDIKSLSFIEDGHIVNNSVQRLIDIDTLPAPDRSLLKGNYLFNRLDESPATIMCVSRGCSYKCTYCAPHALDQAIEVEFFKTHTDKPPLRLRAVQQVINEFESLASKGYRAIELCDNQFVWDEKRTIAICNAIAHLQLTWICYARGDHLKSENMIKLMKDAGCKLIYIGTESFSQKIIDDIKKEIKLKDNYEAVRLLRKCGIEPEVSVLLGASPLETEDTIRRTIREARKLRTRFIHYSMAAPLPNTLFYKIAKQKSYLKTGDFIPIDNIRETIIELPFVSAARMKRIIRKSYLRQYLSFNFIFKMIIYHNFSNRFRDRIRVAFRLLRYILGKL